VRQETEKEKEMKDRDVLTVKELAGYLRVKDLTVYKHVNMGKIPGFKLGSHWRFRKSEIDEWIKKQEGMRLA
jgi:excisionase family DNA binding protein